MAYKKSICIVINLWYIKLFVLFDFVQNLLLLYRFQVDILLIGHFRSRCRHRLKRFQLLDNFSRLMNHIWLWLETFIEDFLHFFHYSLICKHFFQLDYIQMLIGYLTNKNKDKFNSIIFVICTFNLKKFTILVIGVYYTHYKLIQFNICICVCINFGSCSNRKVCLLLLLLLLRNCHTFVLIIIFNWWKIKIYKLHF